MKLVHGVHGLAGFLSAAGEAQPLHISKDCVISALLGEMEGVSIMSAMGEREAMLTTVTGEDIWRGNELTPAPTSHTAIPIPSSSGEQMTVVSENAQDMSSGTGVASVRIHYVDAIGNEQVEDVNLNGLTGVDTVATDIRFIQDMYTLTVGSNGVAEGHIKIYKKGTVGLVYNMIAVGGNKSLVPNRMVPLGKVLVLQEWHREEAQGKRVNIRIRSTDMNGILIPGVFCFKDVGYINRTGGSFSVPVVIPALSIIKVSGWPDVLGAEVGCGWWGLLFSI